MKKTAPGLFIFLAALFALFFPIAAQAEEESFSGKVVEITIGKQDLANSQSFKFMKRMVDRAENEGAVAIVLNLDTPGGLAFETSEFMMRVLQPCTVPTYAFVNKHALSAGALIAASCNTIYMAPVSSIGAAGIVNGTGQEIEPMMRKKLESAFRSFTRSVVTEQGHNPEVIDAMMVPSEEDRQFGSVTLKKGDLLTLTDKEAIERIDGKPLLAKGLASSIQDLLNQESITAPVIAARQSGFEKIAWWIAAASPLLILLGIGGIYMEFKTPGFGLGGTVAIIAFALFFFGNNIAGNLAGYETVALFLVGIILVCVEIFLFPGMIVFGAVGVICMLSALLGGMIDIEAINSLFSEGGFTIDNLASLGIRPLVNLSLGLLGSVILIGLLMKYLPNWAIFRGFSNEDISGGKPEIVAVPSKKAVEPGDIGTTITELRPSGKAEFGGNQYEVVSQDGYLQKGETICLVSRQAFHLTVRKYTTDSRDTVYEDTHDCETPAL